MSDSLMPFPHYPARAAQILDGLWEFEYFDAMPAWDEIRFGEFQSVPGCFDATVPHAGKRGFGVYRRTFSVSRDGLCQLRCGGFSIAAVLYVDRKEVFRTDLPYSGVTAEFETTKGEHELIVVIDNRFEASPIVRNFYDFHLYGGILRSIALYELPANPIQRCRVVTTDHASGRVRLELSFLRADAQTDTTLYAGFDGNAPAPLRGTFRDGVLSVDAVVPNPTVWSPSAPNLHTVEVRYGVDSIVERFGLRTVCVRDGAICLNGETVQLQGYNRHEAHPDFGPALPAAIMTQDLRILRDLNCNFIRGCHYPQDQTFLDFCDSTGFLVWEESLGWGNQPDDLADPAFQERQLDQTKRMVRNSINHPSVILWGFLNECASDSVAGKNLMEKLADTIRREDSSRLVTYASTRCMKDICLSFLDVVSFNIYPGWYGVPQGGEIHLETVGRAIREYVEFVNRPEYKDKPFILSEIGGAALYGCHDRMKNQWSEEYQAALLKEICEQVKANPRVCGLALWQYCDCRTYTAGQSRPRGFNNKGTLDEYRRPKLAYDVVKEEFSK